ncbi:uncharacterized protein LOC133903471 [Phragmites australis]|uniref:uncharacterized protein LOC133903471 n=1 Tax=Phragmites australis TaxID=29695 RepID=UPI002D78828A|nr:uncharacterized protein LOC133903471 [Phragmites australis]XP_062200848.1 uncharacterized protein LOC133903471 [Phragmites australis]
MGTNGGEMTGHCERGPSSAAPVPPLDDDNLLAEILLRLPALPSSLPRVSLVSKRWCRLVSDPRFLRGFRSHHQKPPLLGFFLPDFCGNIEFTSMLDPPDLIPAARFSLRAGRGSKVLGCCHGRVLVLEEQHFLVWDPVTGDLRHVAFPPAFDDKMMFVVDGGVVCTAGDQGHVHGACHSDPFQVVLIGQDRARFFACVYSSETGAWGNLLSTMRPLDTMTVCPTCSSTLIRNSICLFLIGEKVAIFEFDWDRQNLAVIDVPSDAHDFDAFIRGECQFLITPADSGSLSFVLLAVFSIRVWKMTTNGDGVARWMLGNTIELSNLLSLRPVVNGTPLRILGLDEDGNVMFKLNSSGVVFMVHLESMQFKKLSQKWPYRSCHPFTSFCTPGMHVSAGHDEVEILRGA